MINTCSNVKDKSFGVAYFKRFAVVLIALDNESARRHVNRMCLAAGVPLVEAGTSGYSGQAYPIVKGVTACFECSSRPVQKQYPICTIRSTPDKPVHCVVWAKELHKLLFGDQKASYLYEGNIPPATEVTKESAPPSEGASAPVSATSNPSSAYMRLVREPPAPGATSAETRAWATELCTGIFHDDIAQRLQVAAEAYKTAKFKPVPVDVSALLSSPGDFAPSFSSALVSEQRVLSPAGSLRLLIDTIVRVFSEPEHRASVGAMEFTKGGCGVNHGEREGTIHCFIPLRSASVSWHLCFIFNFMDCPQERFQVFTVCMPLHADSPLDVDFVTSATNLRAHTFGIPVSETICTCSASNESRQELLHHAALTRIC
jgi:hypothetical protein